VALGALPFLQNCFICSEQCTLPYGRSVQTILVIVLILNDLFIRAVTVCRPCGNSMQVHSVFVSQPL
jgi:hypothetical protein